MSGDFATLRFERQVSAPVATLWQAWIAPAARAIWAAPTPAVTVEFLQSEPRVGGRELSICKASGQPDIRCEAGWLELHPHSRSVNYEVISSQGAGWRTCRQTGFDNARSISCTSSTMPS